MQDIESFSIRGHQSILDAVMDHLNEVTGAGLTAIQVAFRRGARARIPSRRGLDAAAAGSERLEDRIEVSDDVLLAADHLAVAAFASPHAATRTNVNVMNTLHLQFTCTANVVNVIRVTAIDDDVVYANELLEVCERRVDEGRRDHQPDRAWLLQLPDKVFQRLRTDRAFGYKCLHGGSVSIVNNTLMLRAQKALHHVRAHASQSDHSNLH